MATGLGHISAAVATVLGNPRSRGGSLSLLAEGAPYSLGVSGRSRSPRCNPLATSDSGWSSSGILDELEVIMDVVPVSPVLSAGL
jgi:hypothetical protein